MRRVAVEAVITLLRRLRDGRTAKTVIAVLIGLVSVTGAVLTWRALLLGDQAADNDRRSVVQTATEQGIRVQVEAQLQNDFRIFTMIREHKESAERLDVEAENLRIQGRRADANRLKDEATLLRVKAGDLATLHGLSESEPTFDPEGRRQQLTDLRLPIERIDPDEAASRADRLRVRAERLMGLLVVLVSAVVMLTLAQVSRSPRRRLSLAATATLIWLSTTVFAFAGGRG